MTVIYEGVPPFPDLDETCGVCEGSGSVRNPDFAKWEKDHEDCDKTVWNEPIYCKTHDYVARPRADIDCVGCRGHGMVPTGVGRMILDFLARMS